MRLRAGQLVAFRPGSPPAREGLRRGVVVRTDQAAAAHLRRTARRRREAGLSGLAAVAEAEAERAGADLRVPLVRVGPCRMAPAGFDLLMAPEWLDVVAETPGAIN